MHMGKQVSFSLTSLHFIFPQKNSRKTFLIIKYTLKEAALNDFIVPAAQQDIFSICNKQRPIVVQLPRSSPPLPILKSDWLLKSLLKTLAPPP